MSVSARDPVESPEQLEAAKSSPGEWKVYRYDNQPGISGYVWGISKWLRQTGCEVVNVSLDGLQLVVVRWPRGQKE